MTAAEHIRRSNTLKTKKTQIEQFWKSAFNYTYPARGAKIGLTGISGDEALSAAQEQNANIYDSTLRDCTRLLASQILSGLTPAHSKWFNQEILGVKSSPEAEKYFEKSTDTIWKQIHNCNYDVEAYEGFIDFTIAGMFVLYIEEGDFSKGKLYNFELWPLHSTYFATSTGKGPIDTIYREIILTAEQAVKFFNRAGDKLDSEIIEAAVKKPDSTYTFGHAIYPRSKDRKRNELPIGSEWFYYKTKKIIRKSGYHEMPAIVPRWLPIPDSVYSLGPVDDALPDFKTLNEVVKLVLQNADMAIAGMWGATDDGVLNPKTITIGARKVIMVSSKDSIFPLTPGGKFDVAQLVISNLQKSIRKVMMSDQLQPQDGPGMTATEVHVRVQLIRQLLGPMYGRLMSEFLTPLVERCFGIALRAGAIELPPESVEGMLSKVSYKSPLARSQKLEDVAAMDRFEESIWNDVKSGLANTLDVYDIEEARRTKARLLGVPAELIIDKDKVTKLRAARAEEMKKIEKERQSAEMKSKMMPDMAKEAMKGMNNNAA